MILNVLIIFSGMAFLIYGFLCVFSMHMESEFIRYGLIRFRVFVGWLEVLGGAGLLLGYYIPFIQVLASLGLSLLMLMGIIVRVKVRDPISQVFPAFSLLVVNTYIFILLIK